MTLLNKPADFFQGSAVSTSSNTEAISDDSYWTCTEKSLSSLTLLNKSADFFQGSAVSTSSINTEAISDDSYCTEKSLSSLTLLNKSANVFQGSAVSTSSNTEAI